MLCNESYIKRYNLPKHFKGKEMQRPDNMTLEDMEKLFVTQTLEKNSWSKKKTAKELGIDVSTLWRKIKKYNIS